MTPPTMQPNQPSTSSSSSASRLNTEIPFEAPVVDTTALKEMLNEASLEIINFKKKADEEAKRREITEKEISGAYNKSMFLMNKVAEALPALQLKEQPIRDIEEILEREKLEKEIMRRDIEELKQAKNHLRDEMEKMQTENSQLKLQRDEYFNQIQAANEKNLNLQRQISDFTIAIKDLKEVEALRKQREDRDSFEILFEDLQFNAELKIGEGGFGTVYKGSLRGTTVAIKLLHSERLQGLSKFKQEINVLKKIRHPNLVTLMGVCSKASALIYEYLPNGSLEDRLKCVDNTPPLTWQVRTRIIGEICLALVFLHSSKPHLVVHGDLKPENILLDSNMVSKLSDFGISRLLKQSCTESTAFFQTSNPAGTFAYTDPEFPSTGIITPKSDVYSLGIIILRLLTSKPPSYISRLVRDALLSGTFQTELDQSAGQWPFEEAKELAKIGVRCCDLARRRRPDMVSVWAMVEPLMNNALQARGDVVEECAPECAPSEFFCPIFQEIMKDPHLAADGFTYERDAIKRWLETHNTSPMTNLRLPHKNLIPNRVLRSAIRDWLQKHPEA